VLSGVLMATTLFPHVDVTAVFIGLAIALAVGGIAMLITLRVMGRRNGPAAAKPAPITPTEKLSWRMPPLTLLKPVKWSPGLRIGILALRGYLIASAILLLVKAVQLGGG